MRAKKFFFGASFYFEFLTKDSKEYVNMVFRNDKGVVENVQLECSPSETDTACEKSAFKVLHRQEEGYGLLD